MRLGPNDQLLEHGAEHEEQGVEVVDRGVELDPFFEAERRLEWHHQVWVLASRELMETPAALPQPYDDLGFREPGQLAHGAHAP